MPPKRKPATSVVVPPGAIVTPASDSPSSLDKHEDCDLAPPPAKKAKIVDEEDDTPHVISVPNQPIINDSQAAPNDDGNSDEEDDGRDICKYDEGCYRKNPQHFTEFRHPKLKAKLKAARKTSPGSVASHPMFAGKGASSSHTNSSTGVTSLSGLDSSRPPLTPKRSSLTAADLQQAVRPEIEMYKQVLRVALSDAHKITVDTKKMLKKLRQDNKISEHEHDQCLGQFGWTPDEYEEGEKRDDSIELDEEKEILKSADGFKIIIIRASQKRSKEQEAVWASVTSRFYQTMSKAQANYAIKSIGVIVNAKLKDAYMKKKQEMLKKDKRHHQEEWGFHGSSESSIGAIAKEGFKHPDDLAKENEKSKPASKKKTPAKKVAPKIQVELLDEGYFGKGIYFSMYSDYAMWYSEERESNQILLSKLLTGKVYQCTGRMDGQDRQAGYDSHYSPKGNEIIVFESSQVLPRYIITFEERDAEEREQED